MADVAATGLRQLVRERRAKILEAAQRNRAEQVRVFGSVARGEDGPDRESILGRSVDVVSVGGLKPRDAHILSEAIDLEGYP